jgi:antitoxin component YwqK of YwqJK toxin-antitoxin module
MKKQPIVLILFIISINIANAKNIDLGFREVSRKANKLAKSDGEFRTTYHKDLTKCIVSLKNGSLNGDAKCFYKNGTLKAVGKFNTKGEPDGTFIKYYKNGEKEHELKLQKAKLKGVQKYFYSNGKLKEEISYEDGKANGKFKIYHLNGNLKQEGIYKNGLLHGDLKTYNRNEQLIKNREYENGRPIFTIEELMAMQLLLNQNQKNNIMQKPNNISMTEYYNCSKSLQGCCSWHGGIRTVNHFNRAVCMDGYQGCYCN